MIKGTLILESLREDVSPSRFRFVVSGVGRGRPELSAQQVLASAILAGILYAIWVTFSAQGGAYPSTSVVAASGPEVTTFSWTTFVADEGIAIALSALGYWLFFGPKPSDVSGTIDDWLSIGTDCISVLFDAFAGLEIADESDETLAIVGAAATATDVVADVADILASSISLDRSLCN